MEDPQVVVLLNINMGVYRTCVLLDQWAVKTASKNLQKLLNVFLAFIHKHLQFSCSAHLCVYHHNRDMTSVSYEERERVPQTKVLPLPSLVSRPSCHPDLH